MNEVELSELEQRPEFKANVKAALRFWGNYWRVENSNEVAALPDKERILRKAMIKFIFDEPNRAAETVASMVIADSAMKNLVCYHVATFDKIKPVVDSLLGKDISWFVPSNYVEFIKLEEANSHTPATENVAG